MDELLNNALSALADRRATVRFGQRLRKGLGLRVYVRVDQGEEVEAPSAAEAIVKWWEEKK